MCFLGQIQIVKFFLQLYFTKFILKFLDKKLLTENLSLMSEADRALVSDYVNILKQPKAERRQILDRYNLRKNKNYHTRIFRALIITKFAYKGKK